MSGLITQVGMPSDVGCQPLVHALRRRPGFALTVGTPSEIAVGLRARSLGISFVSPLEYAREGTGYVIVPGVALSSHLPSGTVTLHFREGIQSVNSVAVDPAAPAEVVLAMILLQEQFDVHAPVVPVAGDLDQMLRRADAALLAGNASLRQSGEHANALDLVEHWIDLTGLPYVHGFWCTRPGLLTPEQLTTFAEAASEAAEESGALTQAGLDPGLPVLHPDDLSAVLDATAYVFNEPEQHSVEQFLQYAFYHGMLPDVPDLRFAGTDEDEPPPFH
jgi:chorismate dehydratase